LDFYVLFSVDGTRDNTRRIFLRFNENTVPRPGQEIKVTASLPVGLEGVIRADRVIQNRLRYRVKDVDNSQIPDFDYAWYFKNNNNKFIDITEAATAPDGTEINVITVNAGSLQIPETISIEKAGSGTIAVQEAMREELAQNGVKLVKAAEFIVSYEGEQDGNQALPTVMKFCATSTDVGSAVWNIVSNDDKPENILVHIRMKKIIPTNITGGTVHGTKVVDLLEEVNKEDWEKVFSAYIDRDEEKIYISANIIIIDGSVGNSATFEGIIEFDSLSFLMYKDGIVNGKFEDPIALVSYAKASNPQPPIIPKPGDGGCNVASWYIFMILALLLPIRKKK
jgi:hypothetical protein